MGAKQRMPKGIWRPTLFEGKLLDQGISLINSRPYHLQMASWRGSIEPSSTRYATMRNVRKYIDYYEDRLHWSLDIDNHKTSLRAVHNRKATDAIRKKNPRWTPITEGPNFRIK